MKILVLLTDAFGGQGGIALHNRDLLTALCAYPECEEVVAIPRLMQNELDILPKGLTYITDGINSKIRYVITVFKAIRQFRRFDLILCGHINLLPLSFILRFLIKAPVSLEIHGVEVWKPTGNLLVNRLAGRIDAVVAVSDLTRKRFLTWSHLEEKQSHLLPNAIRMDEYGIGSKSEDLLYRYGLQDKIVVMTLGRMSRSEQYKGFDEIIEILPGLVKDMPNIVYLAIGDGDDRQRLIRKIEQLGVADHVILPGFVDEEEKADHYRLADVFIMPSRGEGFGFVILEALACGIPVIASEQDGTREAVRNGALGQLVDPGNPEQINAAILRAVQTPKEIPDGLEYFSFDRFTQRLHKIVGLITGATF